MELFIKAVVLCFIGGSVGLELEEAQQDVCHNEIFSAQCPQGSVLVITHAQFGHIGLSSCMEIDTGHFGCVVDVLASLSGQCAGQGSCQLPTPDAMFSTLNPCQRGLGVFLRVRHVCVPGVMAHPCERFSLISGDFFISSQQTASSTSSCSSMASLAGTQYYISAQQGQKIELSTSLLPGAPSSEEPGWEVGYVLDETTDDVQGLWVFDDHRRGSDVTMSDSSRVTLSLLDSDSNLHFIIRLRATGCQDLRSPPGMVSERDGDVMTIRCLGASQRRWNLVCRGGHWNGVIGNCSEGLHPEDEGHSETVYVEGKSHDATAVILDMPKEIVLMIIVAVTIVLALIIITTGYVCFKKASISSSIPDPQYAMTYNSLQSSSPSQYLTTASSLTYPYHGFTRLQPNGTIVRFPPPVPPREEGTYSTAETLPLRTDEDC